MTDTLVPASASTRGSLPASRPGWSTGTGVCRRPAVRGWVRMRRGRRPRRRRRSPAGQGGDVDERPGGEKRRWPVNRNAARIRRLVLDRTRRLLELDAALRSRGEPGVLHRSAEDLPALEARLLGPPPDHLPAPFPAPPRPPRLTRSSRSSLSPESPPPSSPSSESSPSRPASPAASPAAESAGPASPPMSATPGRNGGIPDGLDHLSDAERRAWVREQLRVLRGGRTALRRS